MTLARRGATVLSALCAALHADFLCHPDAFARTAMASTPRDRMMAVVRFYLTSFHGFRKGTVARKPYNPVLGEVFKCEWDMREQGFGVTTFVGEQVSHHPPVSAFYVENRTHRLRINAYVWTQSKFLGKAVASMMVGTVRAHTHTH